jgi:hypothetical protein
MRPLCHHTRPATDVCLNEQLFNSSPKVVQRRRRVVIRFKSALIPARFTYHDALLFLLAEHLVLINFLKDVFDLLVDTTIV